MSHFIISSNPTFIFGTPNGQASTQLLQAMQRGFRAVCTTPSPVRLMASAGQTSAQVGCSQCMQTTGTVCTERARSTYSRWIIESPRCVSHSEQAWMQAWQPMQRLGSTKNSRCSGTGMGSFDLPDLASLLRLEPGCVGGRPVGLAHAAAAHLVLGDLADGVLRRHGQAVRALVA